MGWWDVDARIGRLSYLARFGVYWALFAVTLLLVKAFELSLGPSLFVGFSLILLVLVAPMIQRVNDLGWSRWLVVLGFIPLVSLVWHLLLMLVPSRSGRQPDGLATDASPKVWVAPVAETSVASTEPDTPRIDESLSEDALFVQALDEMDAGTQDRALWARALVAAGGDPARARAVYIETRVDALKRMQS